MTHGFHQHLQPCLIHCRGRTTRLSLYCDEGISLIAATQPGFCQNCQNG